MIKVKEIFYRIYKRRTNKPLGQPIRIIAVSIDPIKDIGREHITLLNISPRDLNITDWVIRDDDGSSFPIQVQCCCSIPAGGTRVIRLPKNTRCVPRVIELRDYFGTIIHSVSFNGKQVEQGWTITFP